MHSDNNLEQDNYSWSVLGHGTAKHLLQGALADVSGSLRHAYLFTGARHVGKTTLAREFAMALLCKQTGTEHDSYGKVAARPCGTCRSCRLALSGNHPDLRYVQPLDKSSNVERSSGMLRVEQAAEIIHEAALSPLESHFKCFVIQDIHTANASFSNKLLKTLEEPPGHVILLLTASDRASLLPTIVSRCQILDLRPMNHASIAEALETRWQVPSDKAELLGRLSNGRLGWAIEQIDNESTWQWRQEQFETLWQLVRSDRVSRLAYVEKIAKSSQQEIFSLLELWTLWWRDVMLAQSGCIDSCTNLDLRSEIEELSKQITPAVVQAHMRTLRLIDRYLRHTTNPRLALDVLLLKLPST